MKRSKEAICSYLGWSYEDLEDMRYHYGLTSIPVYATSNGFICAAKIGKKPATHTDGMDFEWKVATGGNAEYCKQFGWIIYETKN